MSLIQYLYDFNKDYQGPMLSMVAAGGGISLSKLTLLPGCSRILRGMYLPYATEETKYFITRNWYSEPAEQFEKKAVCQTSSEALLIALMNRDLLVYNSKQEESCCIAITAALQTNRYRRGDNHAFISFQNKKERYLVETWHLMMPKISEEAFKIDSDIRGRVLEYRDMQDELVSRVALTLATGFVGDVHDLDVEKKKSNGSLTRV